MIKRIWSKVILITVFCLVFTYAGADGFIQPEVKVKNSTIQVSFSFLSNDPFLRALKEGASKEVLVYADVFRHWDILPDEFVTGNKTIVDLYSDPLKGEYIASKYDGQRSIVKRFKSVESMLQWAFKFENIKIGPMNEFEDGQYYVKIKAEAYSDTVVSLLAKMLLIQPKDFSYEQVILKFKLSNGIIIPEK